MKKLTLSTLAVALAFAAVPAFADQPNGVEWPYKTNSGNDTQAAAKTNQVGQDSAQIIQNGQWVSLQAQAGQRAATVQNLLGK